MLCNKCITQLEKPVCPVCREPMFPGRRDARPSNTAPATATDAAAQIAEDAQLAQRLSRDVVAPPLVPMSEAQQFHHIGMRMTYSSFG